MTTNNPVLVRVTRRGFGAALGGCAAAALMASAAVAAAPRVTRRADGPVVGFHADAPWLDTSGRDTPFRPPAANGAFAPDSESLARIGHFL